jgi:MoaA/NifB/PqqE/SkfB family radical SAM enzyme
MKLTGVHFLLTYQCNFECDHCFVWGSPKQTGTFTLDQIRQVLNQAKDLGTVESIYFEGGEPFLYYPILVQAVREAKSVGFEVGLVSNGYWALSAADAIEWLKPFKGLINDLSISTDLYHYDEEHSLQSTHAATAAKELGIPYSSINIAKPGVSGDGESKGQLPEGESIVMYRGRAAINLTLNVPHYLWTDFKECSHEDLREPGRVHVDPLGNVHLCQGIVIGNVFKNSLRDICGHYNPFANPIVGQLLIGGPAQLVRQYQLPHADRYADACHLCYSARSTLRAEFPDILTPDQMYGVY